MCRSTAFFENNDAVKDCIKYFLIEKFNKEFWNSQRVPYFLRDLIDYISKSNCVFKHFVRIYVNYT